MSDECTDIASVEELSVCGRWLVNGKVGKKILGIVHAKEVNAADICFSFSVPGVYP